MRKFHSLQISDIRQETSDCVSIAFEVPDHLKTNFQFIPGQYLTFKKIIGGEELRRNYSICSIPNDEALRVAIKKLEGGRFSTFANEQLQVGDTLEVMPALGKFCRKNINSEKPKHYVAIAAGSGITPIMSILKTVLNKESQSFFTLFYGNRFSDSIIFKEEIEGLKNLYLNRLSVHHILSQEHHGADLFFGRITEEKCQLLCSKLLDVSEVDEFFICGPEPMIHGVRGALQNLGIEKQKIHFELFTALLGKPAEANVKKTPRKNILSQITIQLDGHSMTFDLTSNGDTLLDAGHKAGADLPFACKGGVCATCKAKILEGEVEMEVNYGLEPEEVEAGYVLTCQAHPKTKKVRVSFDD